MQGRAWRGLELEKEEAKILPKDVDAPFCFGYLRLPPATWETRCSLAQQHWCHLGAGWKYRLSDPSPLPDLLNQSLHFHKTPM